VRFCIPFRRVVALSTPAAAVDPLPLRPRVLRVAVVLGRRQELALVILFLGASLIVALSAVIAFYERVLQCIGRVVSAIFNTKE
jgi:hypothetical protein